MRTDERSYVYIYPFALGGCWIVAWLINRRMTFLSSNSTADVVYWICAKFTIWVLPIFFLIVWVERARWREFLELTNPLKGLVVGLLTSLSLIALFWFFDRKRHFAVPILSLALLNAVIVAPLVEEIVFRGFYLRKLLLNGVAFWVANGVTTIFFVSMHLPGWYFQGKLHLDSVLVPIGSLAFLSLVLGLVKVRTQSLYAVMLIHVLNNLYSLSR